MQAGNRSNRPIPEGRGVSGLASSGGTDAAFSIPVMGPFSWDRLIAFLKPREITEVESVSHDRYSSRVEIAGRIIGVSVAPEASGRALRVSLTESVAMTEVAARLDRSTIHRVRCRIERMFDTKHDPAPVARIFATDPRLAPLSERSPGIRIPGCLEPFPHLLRVIIGQQVSVRSATTTTAALVRIAGRPLPGGGYLFPGPQEIAADGLASLGVPGSKRRTLLAAAHAAISGKLRLPDDTSEPDLLTLRAELHSIPGIGPWTVEYFSMRACGDPDAMPSSDLVLRKAMSSGTKALITAAEIEHYAERWRPWRAYATMLLWDQFV